MKNLFLNQFIQGRAKSFLCNYIKYSGIKTRAVIDQVIPESFENLKNSTEAFLDGLTNLDEEFIAATATPQLQKVLLPQIKLLKARHTQIKKVQSQFSKKFEQLQERKRQDSYKRNQIYEKKEIKPRFTVSPYVIFGQTMQERLQSANPWSKTYRVGSNRYICLEGGLQKIRNDHIYGFHCFYLDSSVGFQIANQSETLRSEPNQFQVSFETNADNFEFFVSDFNNLVQKQP